MNGRVCKIGRCLKIVLLSNDNLFPFLNHTCSKDNPPPFFFKPWRFISCHLLRNQGCIVWVEQDVS